MAKALITGGAGFIGSNLALNLTEQGIDVTILDNFSSSNFSTLDGIKTDVIAGDASQVVWDQLPKFDVIFHEQAITDTTVMDQKWMLEQNVESFRTLLKYVIKNKIPLVYASSAGVYGNAEPPQTEDKHLLPLNIYGFSKLQMDRVAARSYKEAKSPITGLRYFNVFGPREQYKQKTASMIYQLAEQMRAGNQPRVFEFGEQERDHIYVKDVVLANLSAWKAEKKGVYNVGTGNPTSFNRIIEILTDVLETNLKPVYFKNPYSFYQNRTQANIKLAEKEIGFKAKWSIEEGIRDYLTGIYGLSSQKSAKPRPVKVRN